MIKFPSINQFRNAVKEVRFRATYTGKDMEEGGYPIYDRTLPSPTLDYVGTVKLHGTNASVVQREAGGELTIQSRNREISIENDNARFAHFVIESVGNDFWNNFFDALRSQFELNAEDTVTVYGEWCGQGIQGGVAISQLEKMFIIFAIRLHEDDETIWITPDQVKSIPQTMYNTGAAYKSGQAQVKMIFDFPHYEITINFDKPGLSQNTLVELTDDVEKECPVAAALGESGTGEGIVWRCITPGFEASKFWFKVKGEKHSVSKVKTLAAVDVEKVKSITEFVDSVLTEARLSQGIEYLKEMNLELSSKSTGDYLRWVVGDIRKEESDTIEASGLTPKDINRRISTESKRWFFEWVKNNDGF
jgi:hypothetical protein